MGNLATTYTELVRATGASERVMALLDEGPARGMRRKNRREPTAQPALTHGDGDDGRETVRPLIFSSCRGELRWSGVHFAYPSRADEPVLDGTDLQIGEGERVALVGPSGCGACPLTAPRAP